MVVELLHVELTVDINGSLCVDGISERGTSCTLSTTLPGVIGIIGSIE